MKGFIQRIMYRVRRRMGLYLTARASRLRGRIAEKCASIAAAEGRSPRSER